MKVQQVLQHTSMPAACDWAQHVAPASGAQPLSRCWPCTGVMDRWHEREPLLRQCLHEMDADVLCFQEVLTGECQIATTSKALARPSSRGRMLPQACRLALPGRRGSMWLGSAFAVCASPRTAGLLPACRHVGCWARCQPPSSSGAPAQRKKQICLSCQVLPVERAAPAVAAQQGRPPASACCRCLVQESTGRSGGCCRRGTTSSLARRRCSTWHGLAACCAGRRGPGHAQHSHLQPAWHACPQRAVCTTPLRRGAAVRGLGRQPAGRNAHLPSLSSLFCPNVALRPAGMRTPRNSC